MKRLNLITVFVLAGMLLQGCDQKQEILRSEKGIKKQLAGYWKRVRIGGSDPSNEVWRFDGDNLFFYKDNTLLSQGSYSVRTTLTKVFLYINGAFEPCLNGKWTVVTLDDNVLVIANDNCGGVAQREFEKQ